MPSKQYHILQGLPWLASHGIDRILLGFDNPLVGGSVVDCQSIISVKVLKAPSPHLPPTFNYRSNNRHTFQHLNMIPFIAILYFYRH